MCIRATLRLSETISLLMTFSSALSKRAFLYSITRLRLERLAIYNRLTQGGMLRIYTSASSWTRYRGTGFTVMLRRTDLKMRSPLNTKTALLGGMLASIGASACCIGPLLLLSLGIGGAWIANLTALEPYRPVFIALVLVFLSLAFRQIYLVKQSCDSEANCAADRSRKAQRLIFWITAPLMLGLVALPWLMPLFYR
jgi:mercuric ion transport protein